MSLYRVKISDDSQKVKTIDIRIDTYEEFIKWFNVFKTFERGKIISYEPVESNDIQENSIL
jgi:hypothetical protein